MIKRIFKSIGAAVVVIVILLALDVGCVIRTLTGFPCPLCATVQATIAFFQGHVVDAFYLHPLFWLTMILMFIIIVRGGTLISFHQAGRWIIATLIVMYLSVYFVRMILLFPDTAPMEYQQQSIGYQWLLQQG